MASLNFCSRVIVLNYNAPVADGPEALKTDDFALVPSRLIPPLGNAFIRLVIFYQLIFIWFYNYNLNKLLVIAK